jgi:hypothetical protein
MLWKWLYVIVMPVHYRLQGPGAWTGAKAAMKRTLAEMHTKRRPETEASFGWSDDNETKAQ